MATTTPTVRAGTLILDPLDGERREIVAGSDAWFRWLDSARTFVFSDPSGHFSARKRRRWGSEYWYAVLRHGGKLRETYLGKAKDVTLERLRAVALQLNQLAAAKPDTWPTVPSDLSAPLAAPDVRDPDRSAVRLRPPSVRQSSLVKTHALARLGRAIRSPLTIVSAPAGYGKTTVIAQWIARSGMNAAWLSLTTNENDPARFWRQLAAALTRGAPQLLKALRATPDPTSDTTSADDWREVVLSALAESRSPVVVVLDDYALIRPENVAIHDAVAHLAGHMSPPVRLVIASRRASPMPVVESIGLDRVSTLRASDLQLTRAETGTLLSQLSHLHLTEDDIARLYAQTEGWVAGVVLAARALSEQPALAQHVAEIGGDTGVVFDYFVENVLDPLSEEERSFVLRCSVLDHMTGALCDAVTGMSQSQSMLEALDAENLFLVPLGESSEWYRFHTLFAGTLRRALRMTDPEIEPELCMRASTWYAALGQPLEAVDYAFAAHAYAGAARLLDAYAPLVLVREYPTVLLERLDRLPDRYVRERLRLSVAHAYSLLMRGERVLFPLRVAEAERALSVSAALLDPATLALVRAEVAALRAIVSSLTGEIRPREVIDTCQRALASLPHAHVLRPCLSLTVGTQQLIEGDARSASRTLDTLMRESEAQGDGVLVSLALLYLGMATLLQGRLSDTLALSRRAARSLATVPPPLTAHVSALRGAVWYERNYLERALTDARRALDTVADPASRPLQGYVVLANTYHALGDDVRSEHVMDQCLHEWESVVAEHRTVYAWLGEHLKAHQAHLWVLRGNVAAAATWARELEASRAASPVGTTPAPAFVREWEDIVLARVYLAERRAVDALALLSSLRVAATAEKRFARLVDILVLQAIAHEALGDTETALQSLWQALELGAPRRLVRSFLTGGAVIQRLLAQVDDALAKRYPHSRRRTAGLLRYAETLLAEFAPHARVETRQALGRIMRASAHQNPQVPARSRLTAREQQVLRLIMEGASNNDIAQALVVSPATVKRHVSNIFLKLGVHSRTQAVARARDLDLLTDANVEGLVAVNATRVHDQAGR